MRVVVARDRRVAAGGRRRFGVLAAAVCRRVSPLPWAALMSSWYWGRLLAGLVRADQAVTMQNRHTPDTLGLCLPPLAGV